MSEISKPDYTYLWSSGGSIVAPSNVKVQTGWTAEVPPFQWENWSQNRQDTAIAHILQKGVSVWSSTGEYYFTTSGERSYVQGSDGNIYVAVADNVGQDPTTDSTDTYWKIAFIDQTALTTALNANGPVVASMRNDRMSVPTAAATATFTADEVVVKSALGGLVKTLPSFSASINLATTGAGGMNSGTAPVNGFVALYAIYNPTTSTAAMLAVNATALAATSIASPLAMPAGYTMSALVSTWATDGSSLFKVGFQANRFVSILSTTAISTTTANASFTSLSISSIVPLNAVGVKCRANIAATDTNVTATAALAGSSSGVGSSTTQITSSSGGSGITAEMGIIPIITAQTIYYLDVVGSGTVAAFSITVSGYEL
jgi:hypothetical protein